MLSTAGDKTGPTNSTRPAVEAPGGSSHSVGSAIKSVRQEQSLNQAQFAAQLDVGSERTVRRWEKDHCLPSHAQMKALLDLVGKLPKTSAVKTLTRLISRGKDYSTPVGMRQELELEAQVAAVCNNLAKPTTSFFQETAAFVRATLAELNHGQRRPFIARLQEVFVEDALGQKLPLPASDFAKLASLSDEDAQFLLFCQHRSLQGQKHRALVRFLWDSCDNLQPLCDIADHVVLVPMRERCMFGEPELAGGTHLQWVSGRCKAWTELANSAGSHLKDLAASLQQQEEVRRCYAGFLDEGHWIAVLAEVDRAGTSLQERISNFFGAPNG